MEKLHQEPVGDIMARVIGDVQVFIVGFNEAIERDTGGGNMVSGYSLGGTILNAQYNYFPENVSDSVAHTYSYSYDDLNRLTYAENTVTSSYHDIAMAMSHT